MSRRSTAIAFGWLIILPLALVSFSLAQTRNAAEAPLYKQANRPIDERVADLLSRMTLEEKAAQMLCVWQRKPQMLLDQNGNLDIAKARQNFGHGNGLGQVGRPSDAGGGKNARDMAVVTNAIQKFFIEESRLGIPVVFHEECLHGHAAIDATSFPQPIGLGATFDADLARRVFSLTAEEARVRGTVGSSRVDLQACKLEYSIVSPK